MFVWCTDTQQGSKTYTDVLKHVKLMFVPIRPPYMGMKDRAN